MGTSVPSDLIKQFEEIYETLPATGWLTREEAWHLWSNVMQHTGPILEVGVYHGRSTVLLAATGRDVYAVDPFGGFSSDDPSGNKAYRAVTNNLLARKIGNVTIYVMKIEEWRVKPVGFAYLDGDHTAEGTHQQITIALKTGARCVAIHDVNDSGDGLRIKRVAEKVLGHNYKRVERLAIWDRS